MLRFFYAYNLISIPKLYFLLLNKTHYHLKYWLLIYFNNDMDLIF